MVAVSDAGGVSGAVGLVLVVVAAAAAAAAAAAV